MSKERKLRREEREREAAERAAARAAAAEKQARRNAQMRSLTGWLPERHSRQTGILAERHRRQVGATIAILVALNILVWAFFPEWSARFLALAVSLLAAPVLYTMLFRRN